MQKLIAVVQEYAANLWAIDLALDLGNGFTSAVFNNQLAKVSAAEKKLRGLLPE